MDSAQVLLLSERSQCSLEKAGSADYEHRHEENYKAKEELYDLTRLHYLLRCLSVTDNFSLSDKDRIFLFYVASQELDPVSVRRSGSESLDDVDHILDVHSRMLLTRFLQRSHDFLPCSASFLQEEYHPVQ